MAGIKDWLPFRFEKGNDDNEPTSVDVRRRAQSSDNREDAWALAARDPFAFMRQMERSLWSDGFFGDFSAPFQPRIDVSDDEDHLEITAELPGMAAEDVEVTLDGDTLVIAGEKSMSSEDEGKGYYRVERAYGSFRRALPLPSGIDRDGIEAAADNGVLTVRLPKTGETTRARRIDVRTR